MKLKFTALVFTIATTVCWGVRNTGYSQAHPKKGITKARPAKKIISETEKGKNLIEKFDCLSCHRPTVRLIGPSYKDIAAKYPANAANFALLTQKIINGGSGTWGEVAMSPHPNLSNTDTKRMVKYILSFK